MDVREAGKLGGNSTKKLYGKGFYRAIGEKGGAAVKAKYGHEHYVEIGRKGGERVAKMIEAGKKRLAEDADAAE